jgi:hypothetical protein
MKTFNCPTGTRVKCTNSFTRPDLKGKLGKFLWSNGLSVCIEFDDFINGHNGAFGNRQGKTGHCWWLNADRVEVITNNITETEE